MASQFDAAEQESLTEFEATVREKGVAAIHGEIRRRLEQWRTISLNIAVTGASGVGKSSFINTIRRKQSDEDGAANVGEMETTIDVTAYPHPRVPNIVFWDLPGAGTPKFPREKYLETVKFDTFDFFVVISNNRFTEDDLWLAKEVQKKGKRFYFVRSKFDQSVENDKKKNKSKHNLDIFSKGIREYCTKSLTEAGFASPTVFLVCENVHLYDFAKLEETFINDLPALKRKVALQSTQCRSETIIKEKTTLLKERVWKVASLAAAVAVVPIPGTSILGNTAIILTEITSAKEAYGLDSQSLEQVSSATGVSLESMLVQLQEHRWLVDTSMETVAELFSKVVPKAAIGEFARLIPIIGSFISGTLAFDTAQSVLLHCIDCMESVALNLIKITTDSTLQ